MKLKYYYINIVKLFNTYIVEPFNTPTINVKISEIGRKILNDRNLSSQIADAIIKHKGNFDSGNPINVVNSRNQEIGVIRLVTNIKEANPKIEKVTIKDNE